MRSTYACIVWAACSSFLIHGSTSAQTAGDSNANSARYSGVLVPAREADIAPRVDGLLQSVHFKPGQFVKKKDLLFEFMPTEKELQLKIERARLERAKAKLQLAEAVLSGKQTLRKKDAASELQLLQAKAERDIAAADVGEAETVVRVAELTILELKLYAPFDGIMSAPLMPEGTFLKREKDSKLARIVQLDPMRVAVEAPFDVYVGRRQVTKSDEQTLKNIELTLKLPDGSEYPHKGRLISGGFQFGVNTQKLEVWAEFPNPDHLLRPGLKVELESHLNSGR